MPRILALIFLLSLFLTSCASITPLKRTSQGNRAPSQKNSIGKSLENTADFDTREKLDAVDLDSIAIKVERPQQSESVDLVKAEKEILNAYAKEDLKKEDPVNTVAEGKADFTLDYKKKHYDFWLNYFSKRESKRFKRHVRNGLKFKKVVDEIFEEEGLPKDLFFVGLIESGYNTHIRSHASAVGPWQFIKGTAKRYDMKVNKQLDERRNIFKATRAAANYFKDLYNIFGSWELALCAYNAGEYRIINAIRKGNTRDYKELVSKKLLPKETIFYIPKVAAAKELYSKVASQLKASGDPKIYQNAVELRVYKGISLKKLAKSLKVSKKTLKTLNPDIRWDYVSRRRKGHLLYVPQSVSKLAQQKIKSLPKGRRLRRVASETKVHRVKSGESLYKIARAYNTTIKTIKRENRLRRNRIFVGQKLKVRAPASISRRASRSTSSKSAFHKVRRGDNLSLIASSFGLSTRELKRMNGLSSNKILVGQKLRLRGNDDRVYVVRRGDNLYRIARKFGLSVRKIVQANSLKGKKIFPKQKIILPI